MIVAGLVSVAACSGAAAAEWTLDPARLRWSQLELRASKLAVKADSEVVIGLQRAEEATPRWLQEAEGQPLEPGGDEVVRVELASRYLGKRSELDLWLDPSSGGAFQRTQLETGKKVRHHRRRALRFAREGVFNATHRATEDTVDGPWREWELSEDFVPYPADLPQRSVVSEPSALFYLLAAGDLDRPAASRSVLVFSKGQVLQVRLTARETTWLAVDYEEVDGTARRRVEERQRVIRVVLEAAPLEGGGAAAEFKFLGLGGDVEIFLEPERRIPVLITGELRYVGRGKVRLRRVVLD